MNPVSIFYHSQRRFFEDDCMVLASAIAFAFLLSLMPFLTLSVMVAGAIQDFFSFRHIVTEDVIRILTDDLNRLIPFISKSWLKSVVIHPEAARSFQIFNLIMLPFVSGLIFHELEIAYRRIFRKPPRPLLLRQVLYAAISLLVIPLLFVINTFWTFAAGLLPRLMALLQETGILQHLSLPPFQIPVLGMDLFSVGTLLLFHLITVRLFLKIPIAKRHTLFSGLIFVLLWFTAKKGFSYYLDSIASMNLLYGSLSSVIILLLWIFYAAITLLFAIEVLYTLHNGT